jgi:hypothetical protein
MSNGQEAMHEDRHPSNASGGSRLEWVKIICLCVGFAALYGILHDQVTARVCVEYFTIGHSPIFQTESPTLLALGWGVIATWRAGLAIGWIAACLARLGTWPKVGARDLVRPLLVLSVVVGVASFCAGVAGYLAANAGWTTLPTGWFDAVPKRRHAVFIADLWAHRTAYLIGLLGGVATCIRVLRLRRLAGNDERIINTTKGR